MDYVSVAAARRRGTLLETTGEANMPKFPSRSAMSMCASPSCAVAGREKGKDNTQNGRIEECRYSAMPRLPREGHFQDRSGPHARRARG
jgi:hypothetical protein